MIRDLQANAITNRDLRTRTNHFGSVHFVFSRIVFFCPGPKFLIRDLQPRFLLRIVILGPGQNTSVARVFRFTNRIFLSGSEKNDSQFLRIVILGPGQKTAAR